MLDLRQTPKYTRFMNNIGWDVEKVGSDFLYIKKFSILGSFAKFQRPLEIDFQNLYPILNKYRVFQIIIEPRSESLKDKTNVLLQKGFKETKLYFVPSKTIRIDLTKEDNELLKEMHYKTRYNIKKPTELKTIQSDNIKVFADFWQACALKQRGMFLSQKKEIIEIHKSFGKDAHILLVQKDKITLAGILLICTEDIAYYMYAASTEEGKRLFAPTIAAWQTIVLAKKLKKKVFDFEGIYDERFPIKSWLGFTRFKKSFGGKIVEYPGCYSKSVLPLVGQFNL